MLNALFWRFKKVTTVRETYGLSAVDVYIPAKLPNADDIWVIKSDEIIGIEVEVENQAHRRSTNAVWTRTEDGSLRNSGVEYISQPIPAKYAPAALKHLFVGDFDQDYCFSPRTSVHVHLNMQDVSTEKVIDLLMIYSLFERCLYRFVGKNRWKNIYCTPITETVMFNQLASRGLRLPWEKYTGLNIIPLGEHGTVEFRHMHGTFDSKKLCVWIDLICRLKAYVLAHKTEEIRRTIINFNGGHINELAVAVFGELAEFLQISDPSEVISRVATIKMGMVKGEALNVNLIKTRDLKSKFFQIKG